MATEERSSSLLDTLTDEELMSRLANGDRQAMGPLFYRYSAQVKTVISRFAPEMTAQDVDEMLQDVFIAVDASASRYKERQKFKSWLYTVAINKTKRWRRSRVVRKHLFSKQGNPLLGLAMPTGIGNTERMEICEEISLGLGSLSAKLRDVFVLFEIEGLPKEEIADILGIDVGNVSIRLHRARKKMSEFLRGMYNDA